MKSAGAAARATTKQSGNPAHREQPVVRECIPLLDLSDCLLEAYDSVARRAYQNYLARGAEPGRELDDWLKAENELLPALPVHVSELGEFVYVTAGIPGATAADLSVGIESRWLVILAGSKPGKDSPARCFCVLELPAEIDSTRAIAVLTDGTLAVRMAKAPAD